MSSSHARTSPLSICDVFYPSAMFPFLSWLPFKAFDLIWFSHTITNLINIWYIAFLWRVSRKHSTMPITSHFEGGRPYDYCLGKLTRSSPAYVLILFNVPRIPLSSGLPQDSVKWLFMRTLKGPRSHARINETWHWCSSLKGRWSDVV